jgi:hypothetical protein
LKIHVHQLKNCSMNIKKTSGIILLVLLFTGGVTAGYLYFSKMGSQEKAAPEKSATTPQGEDLLSLRVYYPVGVQLRMEERKAPRERGSTAIAEATVDQYLKGPAATPPGIQYLPAGARLLGAYEGTDGVLYLDLSDEFRRNFQGDAFAEFLLLKGLYESLISNVQDLRDVKVLIEGQEVETLGGHLFLLYPLKDMISYEQ